MVGRRREAAPTVVYYAGAFLAEVNAVRRLASRYALGLGDEKRNTTATQTGPSVAFDSNRAGTVLSM